MDIRRELQDRKIRFWTFRHAPGEKTSTDEEGEFKIGAIINKEINENTTSTLIAFANNSFVTDYEIAISSQNIPCIYLYNNKDLALNSISYLTEKQ